MLSGIPLIDLKAGDEVYANVLLALAEKAETGKGTEIHVSMLQAAASWLLTTLPLLDFDAHPSEVTRAGNEHRKFVPANAYVTEDGFVYVAIGNDLQWERLVGTKEFQSLARERRETNAGRLWDAEAIHREMAEVAAGHRRSSWSDSRKCGSHIPRSTRSPRSGT